MDPCTGRPCLNTTEEGAHILGLYIDMLMTSELSRLSVRVVTDLG